MTAEIGLAVFGLVESGHCHWWGETPLRDQDPHLWAVFFAVIILASALGGGRLLLRKGKGTGGSDAGEKDRISGMLEAKEKRLTAKLQELDQRMDRHDISIDEYDRLHNQYEEMLLDTRTKLKQVKALTEK